MLIGEYLWIMGGEVDFKEVLEVASTNINVTKLVRGMVSVRWLDGFEFDPDNDRMLQAWRQQNESFVNRLNALHPVQNSTAAGYFQAPLDYFQTIMPQRGAGFIYDAVMSMGFGKCKELAPDDKNLGGNPSLDSNIFEHLEDKLNGVRPDGVTYLLPEENVPIQNRRRVKGEKSHRPAERRLAQKRPKVRRPLNPHLKGIINSGFQGATGTVLFGNGTTLLEVESPGNRKKDTIHYGIYNFRATDGISNENSLE